MTWHIYIQPRNAEGFTYHSETNLGEAEAQAIAADLVAKGCRVMLTSKPVDPNRN